jgi:hypothetical protein
MGRVWNRADDRAGFAVLAKLALMLQLAVPPGFMLARDAGQPVIVVCTGHGPLLVPPGDRGVPAKAPKPNSGAMCAFAGHGGTPTVAPTLALTAIRFDPAVVIAPPSRPTAPGRGLAAPPPPSQAPPTRIL